MSFFLSKLGVSKNLLPQFIDYVFNSMYLLIINYLNVFLEFFKVTHIRRAKLGLSADC